MPYITQDRREPLQRGAVQPNDAGELNYFISFILHRYISSRIADQGGKLSYALLSSANAALQDAHDEFKRTVIDPYEDVKRAENGSVSLLDKAFGGRVKTELTGYDVVKALAAFARSETAGRKDPTPVPPPSTPNKDAVIAAMNAAEEAENKPMPETPPANVSTKRRAPQVLGADPGGADGAQKPIDVAKATDEGDDGSVPRTTLRKGNGAPKGHKPVPVSKRVQSVWDDALRGNGEDDVDSI